MKFLKSIWYSRFMYHFVWIIFAKRIYSQQFSKFIFPVIKKLTTSTLIQDIMPVQPMSGPVSEVFYMDYVKPKKVSWLFKLWSGLDWYFYRRFKRIRFSPCCLHADEDASSPPR